MNKLNSLTIRIFAIFWFTLAIVVMTVLMFPKLDSRQLTSLTNHDIEQTNILVQNLEHELQSRSAREAINWRYLFKLSEKWLPTGEHFILTSPEGYPVGLPRHEMRNIRNFAGLSDNIEQPKKKKYGQVEIIGPFAVQDINSEYFLYRIRPSHNAQSEFINHLFDQPIYLLIVTMLISSPLLLWLAWSLAKPARRLKSAADDVSLGHLVERPELESGPIEFRAAGVSFNQMIRGLVSMIATQQRLLSDISHELRTPLTRLKLAAALMNRKQGSSTELERIETEANRLESMISDLLSIAHNQYKHELNREILAANELWAEVLNNAQFEAEQLNKHFEIIASPQNWQLFGNRAALDSALENVIRNALKYSHHHITIVFRVEQNELIIQVDDDGPGVSDNDKAKIFQPFYRTDEARDRSSGGNGLGLAIVNLTIKQHHGRIVAENSHLAGLQVTIYLPLSQR